MTTLYDEIESLRALDRDALIAKYRELRGREPRQTGRAWVLRRLMWAAQERRLGGLSTVARARLDDLVAEIELPTGAPKVKARIAPPRERADGPSIGTTYVRRWRDRDLRFTIVEAGVEVDGVIHRSLSAAIQSVTGSHWNPSVFLFGRRKAKESS